VDAEEIEEAGADASIPEDEAKPTRKTRGKSKTE
jgi:hypothetical protein